MPKKRADGEENIRKRKDHVTQEMLKDAADRMGEFIAQAV